VKPYADQTKTVAEITRLGGHVRFEGPHWQRLELFPKARAIFITTRETPPNQVCLVLSHAARLNDLELINIEAGLSQKESTRLRVSGREQAFEKARLPSMLANCEDVLGAIRRAFPHRVIRINHRRFD
jgi:hypothetical protein